MSRREWEPIPYYAVGDHASDDADQTDHDFQSPGIVKHTPLQPTRPSFHRKQRSLQSSDDEPLHFIDDIAILELQPHLLGSCFSYSTVVICNAILTSVLFGYSLSVLNSCSNAMALHFQWCGNAWQSRCPKARFCQAAINSILFLGAVVGSLVSGRLVALGRRFSLQLACWIFVAGGLLGALASGAHGWKQLMLARTLVGIGLGIVTVVTPLYISEMTPARNRGFLGAMHQTVIGVGILIGIALGLPLSPNPTDDPSYILSDFDSWWWRVMLGSQAIPALLCLTGFAFVCTEETPHFLINCDRTVDAAQTIMRTYGAVNLSQIEGTLLEITKAVHEARGLNMITLRTALKEQYYRFGLLLGFFLAAMQQVSGINVVISSSDSLFAMAGLSPNTVTFASTCMALSNALSSALAAFFVENWGRRPLLLWGLAGQFLFMAPIGLLRFANEAHLGWVPAALMLSSAQATWLSVVATMGFVTSFSVALGPIVWIYLSEIYPVEIRGTALGTCGAINWVSAFLTVFFGGFLHVTTAFLLFGTICLGGLVCTYCWVVETKGSTLDNSPVSPQSARCFSQLIQSSRNHIHDITLDELRMKIKSSASFPSIISARRSADEIQHLSHRGADFSPQLRMTGPDGELGSLGSDPCLLDGDEGDSDSERFLDHGHSSFS